MLRHYTCKFIFNTNALPRGAENTNAFFRRWEILPFDVEIPSEKRDIHLSKKLKTELSGIFNRVLDGIKLLIVNKDFTKSELSTKMLEEYKFQSNSVFRFITEEEWVPTVNKNDNSKISSEIQHVSLKEFNKTYENYCTESGCPSNRKLDFGKKICQYFMVQEKCTNNETWVFAKMKKCRLRCRDQQILVLISLTILLTK